MLRHVGRSSTGGGGVAASAVGTVGVSGGCAGLVCLVLPRRESGLAWPLEEASAGSQRHTVQQTDRLTARAK